MTGVKPSERIISTLHLGHFDEDKTPKPRLVHLSVNG